MERSAPIWIVQGRFGRATVNLIDRALVEHMHREFNILFKLGGADATFRSNDVTLSLDDRSVLLFNPGVPHAKLANPEAAPGWTRSSSCAPQANARTSAASPWTPAASRWS